jgi:formylmethanofuran dehydrogenase subunit C
VCEPTFKQPLLNFIEMSIIKVLQETNAKQLAEITALKYKVAEMEQDINTVSQSTKTAWASLGLDFSNVGSSEKMSMGTILKISTAIGKKMLTGQISVNDLLAKWSAIEPILKKYDHLINTKND